MTESDWGLQKATLHEIGREGPREVTFELSPTCWRKSAMQRSVGQLFTWRVPKNKSWGLGRAGLVLGTERKPVWLDDKCKGGNVGSGIKRWAKTR